MAFMQFNFTPKHVKNPEEYISALTNGYYDIHISDYYKYELFALLETRRNEHPMIMHSYAKELLHSSYKKWEYAFQLLVELARQKFTPAINTLAYCYRWGRGVERSLPRSNKCLKLAAEQDYLPALYNIGYICPMYFEGFSNKETFKETLEAQQSYLVKAEQLDFYPAKIAILRILREASCYISESIKKYSFSELCTPLAEAGDPEAQYLLGLYIWKQRNFSEKSPEENAALEETAAKWQAKAAANDFHLAKMELAAHYYSGNGVPQSLDAAVDLWLQATQYQFRRTIKTAHFNVARCYEAGIVLPQSYEKAAEHYYDAMYDRLALNNLAVCYLLGRGVKPSAEQAVEHLKDAIDGITEDMLEGVWPEEGYAFYNLAQCYENGYGVQKSWSKALRLYKKATLAGTPDAIYKLASYYELGINVTQSHSKAERLLRRLRNDDPDFNVFDPQKYKESLNDAKKATCGLHLSPIGVTDFQITWPAETYSEYAHYCNRTTNFYL